jgi:hypothetical protein
MLCIAAIALAAPEAKAQSYTSGTVTIEDIDGPPFPGPGANSCTSTVGCYTFATTNGPYSSGFASAQVNIGQTDLGPTFFSLIGGHPQYVLSPSINFGIGSSVNTPPPNATLYPPSVLTIINGTWSATLSAADLLPKGFYTTSTNGLVLDGRLVWEDKLSLQSDGDPEYIQLQFSVENANNTSLGVAGILDLFCANNSCSVTSETSDVSSHGIENGVGGVDVDLNLASLDTNDFIFTEEASISSSSNLNNNGFEFASFIDPMTLTYTPPSGPIDPNLVLYSSDLNGVIPLSGQILTATPLPSTWLMLVSGFAGLGFFAYRETKKNAAIAAA